MPEIQMCKPITKYLRCKYSDDLSSKALFHLKEFRRIEFAAYKCVLYLRDFTRIPAHQWKPYLLDLNVPIAVADSVINKARYYVEIDQFF